jgi:hypothetical protein
MNWLFTLCVRLEIHGHCSSSGGSLPTDVDVRPFAVVNECVDGRDAKQQLGLSLCYKACWCSRNHGVL